MNLKKCLQKAWDYLFPTRCPGCGRYTTVSGGWCDSCLQSVCHVRRLPLTADSQLNGCQAICEYQGAIRKLLKQIKYNNQLGKCRYLTYLLLRAELSLAKVDIVVPIPLYKAKLQKRGYNQTTEIFKDWCEERNLQLLEALTRQKETLPQYNLLREERRQNMQQAFQLAANMEAVVRGKSILLVDDIFTSGTTMREAASVLRKAGAARVYGLVIASDAK